MIQLVTTRQPRLRFLRDEGFEIGLRAVFCWNGAMAANGDGAPGWSDAIDWTQPVQNGGPITIYDRTDGLVLGGWGADGWGMAGYGKPFDWLEWMVPFPLRDGGYKFGVITEDLNGNRQTGPGTSVEFRVVAPVRGPSRLRSTAYDDDALTLAMAFTPSPEFV